MTAGDEVGNGELILYRLDEIKASLQRLTDDHEARLRKLERWAYALPPTLVLAGASVVAALFK